MAELLESLGGAETVALAAGAAAVVGAVLSNRSAAAAAQARLDAQRSEQQTVEIGEAKPGEGRVRRNAKYADAIQVTYDPAVQTTYDLFEKTLASHGDEHCMGRRPLDPESGAAGAYTWETYKEVATRRTSFGSALAGLGYTPGHILGIYSVNRPEWVVADLAAQAYGWPSVALYDTLGKDAVQFIVNHAEIKVVVVAGKQLNNLLQCAAGAKVLETIVCMDRPTGEQEADAKKAGVKLFFFGDLEKDGAAKPVAHHKPVATDIYTIMYTSGTTGNPKGVVLTHHNMVAEVTGILLKEAGVFTERDVHMSYLPLAHSFERAVIFAMLSVGAQVGFFQGNILELFNDIAELKPTFLVGAPRVWARLHDKILLTINAAGGLKAKMFHRGYAAKAAALKLGRETPWWDKLVFSKTAARLGGRVRFILSGSAPLDPSLAEFLKICFCTRVLEGYGLTENAAGAFLTNLDETQFGHVGCPVPCTEAKLLDVPEMKYLSSNTPPTGEILLRGANVFREYYKDQEKTDEALEDDGWFHTGDIGRWNPNGTLSIIDRKKNIFKLSQGEYVAVEYVEGVLSRSPFAGQLWVYGDSFKRFLIAVVVPDADYVKAWAAEHGKDGALDGPELKAAIMADLTRVGQEGRLHGFEFVKAIHVEPEPWVPGGDLVTPTFKLRRPDLKEKYTDVIAKLYAELGE